MSAQPSELANLAKVSCRLENDGMLLWVQLDSPPGNVLDCEMMASLRQVVKATQGLPALRLLAFSGAGANFSYGASVEEHLPDRVAGMLQSFHGLFRDLTECDVPALALVRGQCLGGGLELAAFCDRVVVEDGAQLGQPEIRLGVFAPVGSLVLPWRCGARSSDLLLTGRSMDASSAVECGLADEMVEPGQGVKAVQGWLGETLANLSASSLRFARRASRWQMHRMLRQGMEELERLYLDELLSTHDAAEGIRSFVEKRKPVWRHG
ncbi:MAG: cyclohexa-1,5-dienecarbonyl-CoA hydratase [Acidobacteria bacterium]|nr:MAG: cyclohexa-1,5-dienecarbonyl-CoA hydratase [Acidobacteriota bacterium]